MLNGADRNKQRTANTGLAKVAVQCSADTFVVNQTLVLRINICGENRHLRQAANRWWQVKFISILFRIISLNKNFLISICIKETFKLTLQGERSKTNNISWNTFPKFLH
jgi:hypothetical protein